MLHLIPSKHFADRIYAPYLLAKKLKSEHKNCYESTKRKGYRYQLKYYEIHPCSKQKEGSLYNCF